MVSRVAVAAALASSAAALAAAAPSAATPSFLFMMGDDIGWSDFRYMNGTAATPRLDEWARAAGSIKMLDFHSGGTVCSPTRATVLTGRNHFRDCVNYVYDCSDMTECDPDFEFAPQRTFTIADAVRAANKDYVSHFGGKWREYSAAARFSALARARARVRACARARVRAHKRTRIRAQAHPQCFAPHADCRFRTRTILADLGSFYNDSVIPSSPLTHGFDLFNATVEVAPTATTNCQCSPDGSWPCDFGHNDPTNHCTGGPGPDPKAAPGCCFNYWSGNSSATHGVHNISFPTPDDDAVYNADAFVRFAETLGGRPFLAQISFHNCHIPFVGTPERVAACNASAACLPPLPGALPYNHQELDFYACLAELDNSVGTVLDALKRLGYYDNTLVMFTTDNGPEVNCGPEGRCGSNGSGTIPPGTLHRPACAGAGSAGPLRGRKRDVWEGGHRVPGIISWPAVVGGAQARESWDTVVTTDFHATILDVLGVERPASQQAWAYDGVSVMPILRGEVPAERSVGWMYSAPYPSVANGYAYRSGKWKLAVGGISCHAPAASFNCSKPQLYDMSVDFAEDRDLALQFPDVLAALEQNFSRWFASVNNSIHNESACAARPTPPPGPPPFPPNPAPNSNCTFVAGKSLNGANIASGSVGSLDECCGACWATSACAASEFIPASPMKPTFQGSAAGGTCNLKAAFAPKPGPAANTASHVPGRAR